MDARGHALDSSFRVRLIRDWEADKGGDIVDEQFITIRMILEYMLSPLVAAFAVYCLSTWQTRGQRWWDRKMEAYADVYSATTDIMVYLSLEWDVTEEGRKIPEETGSAYYEKHSVGWHKVEIAARSGDFLLSSKASAILNRLVREYQDDGSAEPYAILSRRMKLVRESLASLNAEARTDLRIGRWPFRT